MSRNPSERGRGRARDQSLPFHPRGMGEGRDYNRRREGGGFGGGRGRGGGGGPHDVEVFSQGAGQPPGVDAHVTKIENESAIRIKQATKKTLSGEFPLRPGFGIMGREVLLWTNYFKLVSDGDLVLYRYSIEISPGEAGRVPVGKKVKRIVQLLLEEHFQPRRSDIATDFKSNLISRNDLEIEEESYQVTYRADDEDEAAPNARQYRVRLQSTGLLTVSELMSYLTSSQADLMFGSKEQIIQALNIVVGHWPKAASTITTVAANRHFDLNAGPQDRMSLGAGLQAIRGFFVSVRAATARILVNVQVKNMAFYDEGPLDKIMHVYMQQNGPNKFVLAKFLNKLSIDVTHITRTNRSGRRVPRIKAIQGLATRDDGQNLAHPPKVPQYGAGAKEVQFFFDEAGEGASNKPKSPVGGKKGKKASKAGPEPLSQSGYISVYDFFLQRHGITIRDTNLPVVNVRTRDDPSYIPAQVCEVLPGQPAKSKLSPFQTAQMIRFAVRRPPYNAQSIATSGGRLLGFEPTNPTLQSFNIDVVPKLLTVPGRVLTNPNIKYAGTKLVDPRSGSWNMQSAQFVTKADLAKWTYLRVSLQGGDNFWQSDQDFKNTMDRFQTTLRQRGIRLTDYMIGQHIVVRLQNLESEIDTAIHRFAINSLRRPKLILVILPEQEMASVYNRVKSACDIKEGILNVCVIDSKFSKANEQYYTNVGLKFNLKLGGRNHSLDPTKLGILKEKKTMVVGIDVTHPSPGSSSNAPSVAGIVASVDEWLGQWPADLRVQTARQEMVDDLDTLFKSRLRLWEKHNGTLPENILVYRDGVSEGSYNLVLEQELPALRKGCREIYPASMTKEDKPRITIVIVGKRHHTRFYPTKKGDADPRSWNPLNGTIVDRGITEARNWDFFLQAHTALQGTARPAHYYIIYDQIFRERKVQAPFASATDAFEDLTHNLCYLFGRATKAVSICPPAYYADLVCDRARCYLSGLFDPSPGASPSASVSAGGGGRLPDANLIRIHPNVGDAMFYI
ncbi:MAG: hypothetical protein Q9195_005160 [Heterodermia aff. obscurata]